MDSKEKRAYISIIVVLLVGAGVALAGSQGGISAFGVPLFALCGLVAFVIGCVVGYVLAHGEVVDGGAGRI